tara:strand:- start:10843 stop:11742 length:900 start_codon:yes stop_codon:yes gene_type:complete
MKNIYKILIALVVLFGSTELTKAQSTYSLPYPGSTHTYSFDAVGAANTTTWWISKTADGSSPLAATEYEFVSTAAYTVAADFNTVGFTNQLTGIGISSVTIKWNGSATNKYYLFLEVSDATCSNLKGYMIDVQTGAFNALIADVTGSATPGTVNTSGASDITPLTCPDETSRSPIVNEGTYSLGTSGVVYRVNREFTNTTNGWIVDFDALIAGATISNVKDASGTTIADVSGYTIGGDQDYILVTVTVNNAISTPDVELKISAANTKDLVTNVTDDDGTDNSATHTFNDIPTIGIISGS